jgi:hypothetical protein
MGAATACSRETTRRPERGRVMRRFTQMDGGTSKVLPGEPRTHNDLKAVDILKIAIARLDRAIQ